MRDAPARTGPRGPTLAPHLLERVLAKLGLGEPPTLDLAGLNRVCAAFCSSIPFDNIRKRIWFAGDRTGPLPGADPSDFFESWLARGNGATCWAINGGLYALVRSLGFDTQRAAGSMMVTAAEDTNHGTVLVTLDGVEYLVDANLGAFAVLPLVPGAEASTGAGIHDIRAIPFGDRFEVIWYAGHSRDQPLAFRTQPEHDGVDYGYWLARYDRTKRVSPFNDSLYVTRRFPDSILTLGRRKKFTVSADGSMSVCEVEDRERPAVLVEEFGISEELATALPPDVRGGFAFA